MANISWLIYTTIIYHTHPPRFSLVGGFSNPVEKIYDRQKWVKFIFTITFRGENTKGLKIHHLVTPQKINMEPKNHPIEKENHLNQTIIFRFKLLIFQGVSINPYMGLSPSGASRWLSMGPHSTHPWKYGEKIQRQKKEDRRFRCFGLDTNFECSRNVVQFWDVKFVLHYIFRGCWDFPLLSIHHGVCFGLLVRGAMILDSAWSPKPLQRYPWRPWMGLPKGLLSDVHLKHITKAGGLTWKRWCWNKLMLCLLLW